MKQLEIEFFWPLTEQIPLDLDYSQPFRIDHNSLIYDPGEFTFNIKSSDSKITTEYRLDSDTTKILLPEEPGIIRKLAYKILGLSWRVK